MNIKLETFFTILYKGCLQFESDGFNREGVYTLVVSNIYGSTNRSLSVRFHHQKPFSLDGLNSPPPIVPSLKPSIITSRSKGTIDNAQETTTADTIIVII